MATDFSLLHRVQTDSGVHAASYPMGTACSFLRIMRSKRETDHSLPTSSKVKNGGAIPPFPIRLNGMELGFIFLNLLLEAYIDFLPITVAARSKA
jgi:hypothetical protein